MPAWPAPAAIAAMPITMESSIGIIAFWIASVSRDRCPATICPVSCAMTPLSSSEFLANMIMPLWMNMFWPSATKEFTDGSFTR